FCLLNVREFCCKVIDIRTHSFIVMFRRLYNNTKCVLFVHPEGEATQPLEKRTYQGLNDPGKNL
ncbi:hypothetical protein, partial [Tetragenococcus halophilus]|uniref:hypothetical protein n=1 Tax=Tetragenococcus halophilus TaxID=51669 RepID=UPI0020961137